MKTLMTRSLAAVCLVALAAPILAQDKKPDTPASLVEQALYAEEHERDFERALELYGRAAAAAQSDPELLARAQKGIDRAAARQRGAPAEDVQQNDPILCGIANCIDSLRRMPDQSRELSNAFRDIALYGPTAVPWLEKAIAGPYTLCGFQINGSVDRYVRAIADMHVPESDAALKRLLKSVDPLMRRAVAEYSDADRQRAILMLALQDSTPTVRRYAIGALAKSSDPGLVELMSTYAIDGNEVALNWLTRDSLALTTVIASERASAATRQDAAERLEMLQLPQKAEVAAALLALAHADSTAPRKSALMWVVVKCLRDHWKPLDPEIAKRVQRALTADLDGYPQPAASLALLAVGGGPAIESLAGRLSGIMESLGGPNTKEGRNFLTQLQEQLGRLKASDFKHVAAAYRSVEPRSPVGSSNNAVHDAVLSALSGLTLRDPSSLDVAAGAEGLDGEKFDEYARVATQWLGTRRGNGVGRNAPSLEHAWIPLLRRMTQSTKWELRQSAAFGFSDVGDPALVPDLVALLGHPNTVHEATNAINRIIRADPAKSREIIEEAMKSFAASNGRLSPEIALQITLLAPAEGLLLAEKFWKQSTDTAVHQALYQTVCDGLKGTDGSAFLLRHFDEMRASPHQVHAAIKRFGAELYEPAIDVLGQSLKDANPSVRLAAQEAFAAFKTQREALTEFQAWKTTADEQRTTIDELSKLLDSPNLDVVIGAVKSLGALKARVVYPKLVKMLERKEPELKAALQAALGQLGQ
jgi:hypothetical protein